MSLNFESYNRYRYITPFEHCSHGYFQKMMDMMSILDMKECSQVANQESPSSATRMLRLIGKSVDVSQSAEVSFQSSTFFPTFRFNFDNLIFFSNAKSLSGTLIHSCKILLNLNLYTLPETHVAHETLWLEDEFSTQLHQPFSINFLLPTPGTSCQQKKGYLWGVVQNDVLPYKNHWVNPQ